MTLLHGFSAQLEGKRTMNSGQGLSISLVFEEEPFTASARMPTAPTRQQQPRFDSD